MFLLNCKDYGDLNVIYFIKNMLNIVCTLVPVILVILVIIKLINIVLKDEDFTSKVFKSILTRTIAAMCIFMFPSFIMIISSALTGNDYGSKLCWSLATSERIEMAKKTYEAQEAQAAKEAKEEKDKLKAEAAAKKKEQATLDAANKQKIISGTRTVGSSFEDVVIYNQCDSRWGSKRYNSETICRGACGPTSTAIVAATLLGDESITPVETSAWISSAGKSYTMEGNKSYLENKGLEVSQIYDFYSNQDLIIEKMSSGDYLAIASVKNKNGCPFTGNRHFLVITGMSNGEFTIVNPNGYKAEQNYTTGATFSMNTFINNCVAQGDQRIIFISKG